MLHWPDLWMKMRKKDTLIGMSVEKVREFLRPFGRDKDIMEE